MRIGQYIVVDSGGNVCKDAHGDYLYARQLEAETDATRLMEETGKVHYVCYCCYLVPPSRSSITLGPN